MLPQFSGEAVESSRSCAEWVLVPDYIGPDIRKQNTWILQNKTNWHRSKQIETDWKGLKQNKLEWKEVLMSLRQD